MVGNFPRLIFSLGLQSNGLGVHTLSTGVQEAMAEILALQDFLNYVISIHPRGINSFQLIFH